MIESAPSIPAGVDLSNRHLIESVVLDINFDHQQVADDFQQQAHDFMQRRLLPAIDNIFNDYNIPETMVSIDKLVIDLGNVEHEGYLEQIEIRVLEAISLQLLCIKDNKRFNQSGDQVARLSADIAEISMTQYSVAQGQWQQLTFYLLNGMLPWNGQVDQYHDPDNWQQWLLQRVFHHSKKLQLWLATHGQRQQIIERLVNQLTTTNIIALLLNMLPTNERTKLELMLSMILGKPCQHRLTHMEHAFFALSPWIYASEQIKRSCFLSMLFDDIVTHRHFSSNSACRYLLNHVSPQLDPLSSSLRNDFIAMYLTQPQCDFSQHLQASEIKSSIAIIFYQAVLQGSRAGLLSIWALANKEHASVFVEVLTQLGKQERVRYCLAANLSLPMLTDLVLLLEPNESEFILQVQPNVNQVLSSLKTQPQNHHVDAAEKASQQIFWQFTLTYLLVERGSDFNRKSYLLSLIRQASAHFNLSQQQVHVSLMDSLSQISPESKLKRNLVKLLSDVVVTNGITNQGATGSQVPAALSYPHGVGVSTQEILSRLAIAILEGQVAQITPYWSVVISEHLSLLRQALYLWGQDRNIIRIIVNNFSQSMLKDILQCLAPTDKLFILSIIEMSAGKIQQSNVIVPLGSQDVTQHLWTFSLSYLLMERGSQFNRVSYLGYLTQQVAAHHNLDHQTLLQDLVSGFYATLAPSALKDSILGVLGRLLIKPIEGDLEQMPLYRAVNESAIDADYNQALSQFVIALCLADHRKIKAMIQRASHRETKAFNYIVMHFAKVSPQILLQLNKATEQTGHYLMQWLMPNIMVLIDELMSEHSLLLICVPFSDIKCQVGDTDVAGFTTSTQTLVDNLWYKLAANITLTPFISEKLWLFLWQYIGLTNTRCEDNNKVLHHLIVQVARYRNLTSDSLIEAILHCVKGDGTHQLRVNQYQYLRSILTPYSALTENLITADTLTGGEQGENAATQLSPLDIECLVYRNKLCDQLQVIMVRILHCQRDRNMTIDHDEFRRFLAMFTQLYQDDYLSLEHLMAEPLLLSIDWTAVFKQCCHVERKHMQVMVFNLIKYRKNSHYYHFLVQTKSIADFIYTALCWHPKCWSQTFWTGNSLMPSMPAEVQRPHFPTREIQKNITPEKNVIQLGVRVKQNPKRFNGIQQCQSFLQRLAHNVEQLTFADYLKELDVILVYLKRHHGAEYKSYLLQYLPHITVHLAVFKVRSERECHEIMAFLYGAKFRVLYASLCYLVDVCPTLRGLTQNHKKLMWSFMCQYVNSSPVINQTQLTVDFLSCVYQWSIDSIKSRFKKIELFIHQLIAELEFPSDLFTHSSLTSKPLMLSQHPSVLLDHKVVIEHLKGHVAQLRGEDSGNICIVKKTDVTTPVQNTFLHAGMPTSSNLLNYDNIPSNENTYVANAGIVIAAPYIPRLFAMLSLTHQGVFIDDAARNKAVHVLQYFVTEQQATPEFLLTLNKMLCGVNIATPISYGVELTSTDIEVITGLLEGIIQNWSSIGQTSISGLRGSFLQREGIITQEKGVWKLNVPPKAFDMLLDSIPWSFAVIKFPWMESVLHVEWR